MKIDRSLLDALSAEAAAAPRKRMNRDLRNSAADTSQRMLNALEPGTAVPIHRHRDTTETVILLRGRAVQHLYDEKGREIDSVLLAPGASLGMNVATGCWHRLEALESGTVIFEAKDGAYRPTASEDIMPLES